MILSMVELGMITLFYRTVYTNAIAKKIVAWLALTGVIITLAEFAIRKTPMNSITLLYDSSFFFGMGLYAFYEIVLQRAPAALTAINASIMILFLGSAVYFSAWQFMKYEEGLFRMFGMVHAFLLISCYGLFTYGLWRLRVSS